MAALPTIAYISQRDLFIKEHDAEPQAVESTFVEQLYERDARQRQNQDWRGRSPVWGSMSSMSGMDGFGGGPGVGDARMVMFLGVSRAAAAREMLYVLHTGSTCGLFHYKLDEAYERRLVHRQVFEVGDISVHPSEDVMVCRVQHEDGSCNLARADREGRKLVELTSGDSCDECPSWVGHGNQRIVFQTAGVGRNEHGLRAGLGPYAIAELDLENERLDTLLEDGAYDYLMPHRDASGVMHYVRRPYDPNAERTTLGTHVKDVLLFPFRLVRAGVHFLNAFSMIFSGKPLYTAGGPRMDGPDERKMLLWGRLIDAERAQRDAHKHNARPLVPRNWQLCRRDESGHETELAGHVLSYDLLPDGDIVYTTGSRIIHRTRAGAETTVHRGHMIRQVVSLSG